MVINNYLSREIKNCMERDWTGDNEAPGNEYIKMVAARAIPNIANPTDPITVGTSIKMQFEFISHLDKVPIELSLLLFTFAGVCIFNLGAGPLTLEKGKKYKSELEIPGNLLNDDIYTVNLLFVKDSSIKLFTIEDLLTFEVVDEVREGSWFGKWPGAIRPNLPFTLTQ
jgi:lipopolysaccharide transport system ATP-binding protein